MRRAIFNLIAVFGFCITTGCTTVLESGSLWAPSSNDHRGISYTLAKAMILTKVRVVDESARFIICVSEEIPTMDTQHQYVMTFRNSALSADKISVRTYPTTNILYEIDVTAVDQTDQFIINLASSAGAIRGALQKESGEPKSDCSADNQTATDGNIIELAALFMDPGDSDDVRRKTAATNEAVMAYVDRMSRLCRDRNSPVAQNYAREACEEYMRIAKEFHQTRRPIGIKWKGPEVPHTHSKPNCSVGICYRPRLTHILTVDVMGVRTDSQAFSLTNSSPLLSMDISRGIAITKTTKITFDLLGQPSAIMLRKGDEQGKDGSEALELAKLPATVISTYFGVFNKTVGLVATALSNQETLAKTHLELQRQKALAVKKETGEYVDRISNPPFAMIVGSAVELPKKLVAADDPLKGAVKPKDEVPAPKDDGVSLPNNELPGAPIAKP